MASAANRVYQTTELLEDILLYLPLRDLLLAQRIGGKCRNLIRSSGNCRKALFLEPLSIPTDEQVAAVAAQNGPALQPGQKSSIGEETLPEGLPTSVPANPLLNNMVTYGEVQCLVYHRSLVSLSNRTFDVRELVAAPPEASWRKMLVVQPHSAPLYGIEGISIEYETKRSALQGLTMGELVEMEVVYQQRLRLGGKAPRGREREALAVGLTTGVSFTVKGKDMARMLDDQHSPMIGGVCGWDILASR